MQPPMPPKNKKYKDEWGTGTREGYEDRPKYQPRKAPLKPRGNAFLRSLGGMLIVGGIFWGVYVFAASGAEVDSLRQHRGPALVCGAGVIVSLLGKYIRL